MMLDNQQLFSYVLRLADDQLILGQRLGEWCGHAPNLEEELALANIALDLLGQARSLYAYAAEVEGKGRDEDQIAFMRYEREYENALLVEQPNGDFAHTIARQLFYSVFMEPFWQELTTSKDQTLAGIAAKALKEVTYHVRHSAEWTIRLGDGTEESRSRMIEALDNLYAYTGELFEMDELATAASVAGVSIDVSRLKTDWDASISGVLAQAKLEVPTTSWMQTGGRQGEHSEHFGHILSELQFMQRAYPGLKW